MCLYSATKKATRLKHPLTVYKVYFRNTKDNLLYGPCTGVLVCPDKNNIVKGEFLFNPKKRNLKFNLTHTSGIACFIKFIPKYEISDGFIHCYFYKDLLDNKLDYKKIHKEIYKCIIPKGTLVYYGQDGDIAARKIKIIEKCV